MSSACRQRLFDAAVRFCDAFAYKQTVDALLTHFSTETCEVFEHGLPRLAPFLGRSFVGHDGVREYFSAVAALVTYEDMHFSEHIVDDSARRVSVKGVAKFTWIATGHSWNETFAYMLDFDEQNKITRYQIWGDTGALYLARQGCLGEASLVVSLHLTAHTLGRAQSK